MERVGIEDFFSETQIQNQTLETLKAKIAADPELAAQLQNPDLTPAEKEQMLNGLTHAVMQELGYASDNYDNRIVAVDDPVSQDGQTYQRLGFYSDETNDAYINDAHLDNTAQLVTVAGHELSHAMDARSDQTYSDTDNEIYATNFGLNFANYTDLALDINGYDAGMASENGHRGYYAPQLSYNNQEYSLLDKSQGDSFGPVAALIIPAVVLYLSDIPTANAPGENENLDVIPQTTDLTQIGFDAAKEFTGHEWDAEIDIASMLGNPKTLVTDGIGIFNSVTGRVDSSDVNQISQMVDGASAGSSGSIPSAEVPGAGTNSAAPLLARDRVLANIAESQSAREASSFNQLGRYETAYDFYRQSGFDANSTIDHIRGIDLSRPVDVVTIPKGTEVIQYQIPGAPVGNYFALPDTRGNQLGFYTSGRQATSFISIDNVQVLRSTASSTIDDWSMKDYGWEIYAPGGAQQFFTRSKSWGQK